MNNFGSPETVAVIFSGTKAQLVEGDCVFERPGILIGGEEVIRIDDRTEWIGFYDWLRNSAGQVVGIRLKIDDPVLLGDEFEKRMAKFIDSGVITGIFGNAADVDESLSDDGDFGGNVIAYGSDTAVAITFNRPQQRIKY